jgi:hypothetical protein
MTHPGAQTPRPPASGRPGARYLPAADRWLAFETARGVPLDGPRLDAFRLVAEMEEQRSGTSEERLFAEEWKAELFLRNIIDPKGKNTRQAFRRLFRWLVEQEAVGAEQLVVDGVERTRVWFGDCTIIFLAREPAGSAQ